MNNFRIDVTAMGEKALVAALSIVFEHACPSKCFIAHATGSKKELILFWAMPPDARNVVKLTMPLGIGVNATARFILNWLTTQDYGSCATDIIKYKGWRLYRTWGREENARYAMCAIQPVWTRHD